MAKTKSINIKKEKKGKKLTVIENEFNTTAPKTKAIKDKNEVLHFEEPEKKLKKKTVKKRKPKMPDVSEKTRNERRKKNLVKKITLGFGAFLLISLITSYFFIISPALRMRDSLMSIKETASHIFTDIEKKDIRLIDTYIGEIRNDIQIIQNELGKFSFLKTLPFTRGYYENIEHIQSAVEKTYLLLENNLDDMKEVLEKTGFNVYEVNNIPVDIEGETDPENPEQTEEVNATSMILSELPSYISFYEQLEPDLYAVFEELGKINTKYVPNILGYSLKDSVQGFKQFLNEYPELSTQTLNFMRGMPELVGSNEGPTNYLIVLQNEAEMRASGGLLTAFGNMTLENGEFNGDITFSDMWNLENYVSYTLGVDTGNTNIYGQLYLMNLGCGSAYLRAQDAGLYPDLYWTAEIFKDYYDLANEYNPVDFPDYDHIIILNTSFAENVLSLIQPLEVEGYGDVTADGLVDFIKEETDRPDLAFSPERKAIIKEIANAAKEKFTELPLTEVPNIVRIFVDSINAKDLAFYSNDLDVQDFFDQYSMSGRIIKNYEGDYFHFNEAQNCSLKLNKFVRNDLTQDIFINEDGSISKTVSVNWTQPQIWDESLELQYDSDGNFTYRAWVRLFTPEGSENFVSDGLKRSSFLFYQPLDYFDEEMNKHMSDNIIRFDHRRFSEDDPIPEQDLIVSYDLPRNLNYEINDGYKMLVQKHPGKSWGENYTINIHHNGQVHTLIFTLNRDKVINYKNGIISVENYETKLDWLVELTDSLPLDIFAN